MGAGMSGRKDMKLLLAGLQGSGRDAVLESMKLGRLTPVPSGNPHARVVRHNGTISGQTTVTMYDGQEPFDLWTPCEGDEAFSALILVVDTGDRARLAKLREALHQLLAEEDLLGLPLLVIANQTGRTNPMTLSDLATALELNSIWNRRWNVQAFSSNSNAGLFEGMDWLARQGPHEQPKLSRKTSARAPMLEVLKHRRQRCSMSGQTSWGSESTTGSEASCSSSEGSSVSASLEVADVPTGVAH